MFSFSIYFGHFSAKFKFNPKLAPSLSDHLPDITKKNIDSVNILISILILIVLNCEIQFLL